MIKVEGAMVFSFSATFIKYTILNLSVDLKMSDYENVSNKERDTIVKKRFNVSSAGSGYGSLSIHKPLAHAILTAQ